MSELHIGDVEARVDERGALVAQIARGGVLALVELIEYATGVRVRSVGIEIDQP